MRDRTRPHRTFNVNRQGNTTRSMATLYNALKFLRYPDHVAALREHRVVAPIHIRLKPTNHCNHHCWYCAYKADNLQLGEEMQEQDSIPPERMDALVDDIITMGVKAVTFSGGGEPLLYKPLPKAITQLHQGGVKVAAITNGSNLKGHIADALAAHATWVRISLDAWDDPSYQQARGTKPGDFHRLLDNIHDFTQRHSPCTLGVSFIITHDNHPHITAICQRLKQVGVNHVKLSGAVVSNDGGENNRYHATIAARVQEEIRTAQTLADDRFTVINHYHELEERFHKGYATCPFLMFLTVIGADQCVYTCQDKAYTHTGRLGCFKEGSFKAFWFSEENRRALFSLNPSRDCPHHCVSHTKNLAILDFLAIDPDHGCFV